MGLINEVNAMLVESSHVNSDLGKRRSAIIGMLFVWLDNRTRLTPTPFSGVGEDEFAGL